MVHDTTNPVVALLLQEALQEEALYEGALDGVWGPASEAAFAVYSNYRRYAGLGTYTETLTPDQHVDLARFVAAYKVHVEAYGAVAEKADVPVELVAAIHWRESGGDFTTYLHNGDPLGKPTVHDPKGILFNDWTAAAIDALKRETAAYGASGIEEWTSNLACMCVFAEYYNGEGYRARGVPDPYVLAGTSGYKSGKFVEDDVFNPAAVDDQLGVLVMLRSILPATS